MDLESTYREEAEENDVKREALQPSMCNPQLRRFTQELNDSFYRDVSESFSQSRRHPWTGWEQILKEIKNVFPAQAGQSRTYPLSVIDFGCGNGRFGIFLEQELPSPFFYVGIDNNTSLLKEAKNKLPGQTFEVSDITSFQISRSTSAVREFDISACFGVLHHLYGQETRLSVVEQIISVLRSPGLACLSFWQPHNNEKYILQSQRNIALLKHDNPHLPFDAFNAQDLILSWQKRTDTFRYVHSFTEPEILRFLKTVTSTNPDVTIRCIFRTDAGNDENNTYAILQKG